MIGMTQTSKGAKFDHRLSSSAPLYGYAAVGAKIGIAPRK
jgi:hypothetical protein